MTMPEPEAEIHHPPSEKRNVLRAAGVVGSLTLLSRFTGLIRDSLLAGIFGKSRTLDVFLTSFELSNLTRRVLGEGALSSFVVPLMAERRHEAGEAEGWRFFNLAVNVLLAAATLFTILGLCFSREVFLLFGGLGLLKTDAAQYVELGARLTRLMFPFVIGLTLGSVMMGACHTLRVFGPPTLGSVMLNLSMIVAGGAALILRPPMEYTAVWLGWSVLAGAVLRVLIMTPALYQAGWRWRPVFALHDSHLRRLLRMMIPGLLALGIVQLNLSVAGFFAMYLGAGVNTSIKMANRLIQFPMALTASAAATAMLPQLSQFLMQGRLGELRDLMALAKRLEIVIMLPAILGLVVLGLPIIELIFQHGHWDAEASRMTYTALLCYAPGLLPQGWIRLLEPLFFARQDRITPLKAASLSMIVNLVLNWALAFHSPLPRWGVGQAGLALANTAASFVNYFALAWWLRRTIEQPMGAQPRIGETFWKSLLAAAVACAVGAALYAAVTGHILVPHHTLERAAVLLPVIGIVAALHFGMVRLLRVPDSARATAMILGKLKR